MKVLKPTKKYEVVTVEGKPVTVTFFHKENGETVDGITSEVLLEILINRHREFMNSVQTQENINIFTHLSQARVWMTERNIKKQERKKAQK